MELDHGKQVGIAIRVVLDMQSDCIRLFHDLDRALNELRPLLGNLVTTGLSTSINASKLYISQWLFRLYASKVANHRVLGVNICIHDHPTNRFEEPLFVVANVGYDPATPDRQEELQRSWDPWSAFLDWNEDRCYGKALAVSPKRATIQSIVVAAVPLYSIASLDIALQTIDLVGRP